MLLQNVILCNFEIVLLISLYSNLWIFVSNFTDQNAKQLYRIYRQAMSDHRPPEVKKEGDKTERKSGHEVRTFCY